VQKPDGVMVDEREGSALSEKTMFLWLWCENILVLGYDHVTIVQKTVAFMRV
jgi:hypothetical protein